MTEAVAEFPESLGFLFQPSRYKVAYGGRGSGKSWAFARALLILGAQRPLRILCAREFQRSIQDSVHRLLADQIAALGLSSHYEVQNATIRGTNGTEITFWGLKHNVANIKSVEGADIVWVEEADNVSRNSWQTLIPTIRKPGSEIWVSFNPKLDTDETYQRFVVNPPESAVVKKVGWQDNPWFPEPLRAEMAEDMRRDPDMAMHIWEGQCRQVLDGAIYASELRAAISEGRVAAVPHDAGKPVYTFWDLGWADMTSIIMAQSVGQELRVIDYIQDRHKKVSHYVAELQRRPYMWGVDWLPHDAAAETLAAEMSVERQLRNAGRNVQIVPRLSLEDGINAARTVFNRVWFDAEKCADLISCLKRYRYKVDEATGQYSRQPLHDDSSHGADAFRYFAVCSADLRPKKAAKLHFKYEF